MIETLLGTLFGGAFRLAPEVLKWMDRKNERAHEALMADKSAALEQAKAASAQRLAETNAAATISAEEIHALIEATKAQAQMTGIKLVDGLNSLVRPVLAVQWLILLWPAVVVAGIVLAVQAGTDPITAIKAAWGVEEKAMASSIASFWLVDRSLRYIR